MTKSVFAWAVCWPKDAGFADGGLPSAHYVGATRALAMESFASAWRHSGHTGWCASAVWQAAYRKGWRLKRVLITTAFEGAGR